MISKIIKGTSVVFALLLGGLAVLITKPWDDFQSWRWFTLPAERTRSSVFRHWEVIQPTGQLAGTSTPRVFARNLVDASGITYTYEGQHHAITEYFERANIAGFMVLADEEVRLEYYAKGYSPTSLNHIWSATKSFTATIVGMALHDGVIESLDDPVQKYAPQFVGTEYGPTAIRHVMMMSSGIDFKHFDWKPDRNDMYRAIIHKGEDFDAWAAALGRRVPAGTDFNYIATDTHVLSAVLRGAYKKPFLEIVQEQLWEPGGFGAAQWGKDHHGNAMGHCCLSVTLQDFANLGQLYLDDLTIDGSQTVNNDWINMVEHAQAEFQEPHYEMNENGEKNLAEGYSFQFWLPLDYEQEFVAKGAFGQYLWVDRKNQFVVAQFSTGQSMITLKGQAAIKPEEFAAVARAMKTLKP
jgi:CubicO group peptidase (beta-lactamase class C family)